MKTEIVHEDDDILVIYKPAGIATQSSKAYEKDVYSEIKKYLKGGYLGVVHRLDQPVEGLLVFGKNPKASAALSKIVQSKMIFSKDYMAVVYGEPKEDEGELINMLLKKDNLSVVVSEDCLEAKKAVLKYKKIKSITKENEKISLLSIRLDTGRFHQIRAQLSHAGMPILGDRKYGTKDSNELSDKIEVKNVSLCANHLAFMLTKNEGKKAKYEYSCKPRGKAFALFE